MEARQKFIPKRCFNLVYWSLQQEIWPTSIATLSCLETTSIDDYAKDGGEELFTKMHRVLIPNLDDSIGIQLKNAMHLGDKFNAAIFSVIVYY